MAFIPDVQKIEFEGPKSKNPLAFKHYDAAEVVDGKSMAEHLRFSVAYWHTFRGDGSDPFGPGTISRPWDDGTESVENAKTRARVAFEVFEKLGVPFYCFHDRDVAPEGDNLRESNRKLDEVVAVLKEEQERSGVRLLWGTANLFSNPRFAHGAATSPNADVFAYAAAQVKKAIEVTHELGGENYVFWGGREGYQSVYNTDMRRELDHMGSFLRMAHEHCRNIGFSGQLLVEPKPREPMKHQYDYDVGNVIAFLRAHDLLGPVKLNVETNHATLAGHDMIHEIELAASQDALGSVDANVGDPMLGWDTDQFPTNIYLTTQIMMVLLRYGGISPGGLNFDAKVRRESYDVIDIFHAHIGAMDALARGLKIAAAIKTDGALEKIVRDRYSSYDSGIGKKIDERKTTFAELESYMIERGNPARSPSGRQELLENLINEYI